MRVNLKGLAKTSKTLADGSKRTYYYAWRGGPLLKADDGTPLQLGDPLLVSAFAEAHAARKTRPDGNMGSLVQLYRESSEFKKLAEKTRRDYRRYLDMIDAKFGKITLEAIEHPKARGNFKAWRDSLADNPRKADYAWTILARVLSVAKDRGKISVNPCERGGRLYEADRAEKIWTADDLRQFLSAAPEQLRVAMLAALWTGQRQGDLLKLTWHQYDGQFLRLKQGKTGKRVRIPVSGLLKEVLDDLRAKAPTDTKVAGRILLNSRGQGWTEDGFRASWSTAYERAGLPADEKDKLHFHDLRGTAVTRLALAGCSTSEIASFTGHSLKDVEALLDAHYLGGRFELAEQAMVKLEEREQRLVASHNKT
jgi:integrase